MVHPKPAFSNFPCFLDHCGRKYTATSKKTALKVFTCSLLYLEHSSQKLHTPEIVFFVTSQTEKPGLSLSSN